MQGPTAEIVPLDSESFQFECRPDVSCFGKCCSNLTLMLLPYDVLRLRSRLQLSSAAFLDEHAVTVLDPDTGVPRIRLRMGDDENKSCPFLGPKGCAVYEDRPSACRMFPLGRAATTGGAGALGKARLCDNGVMERFFLVREQVCAGFAETREWRVDEWLDNEGLRPYIAHNDRWLGIFTRLGTLAKDPHAETKFSVFRTAGYDLDRFRELVTGEAFTSRFEIAPSAQEKLARDDEALLGFAVRWLGFALFGDRTMNTAR